MKRNILSRLCIAVLITVFAACKAKQIVVPPAPPKPIVAPVDNSKAELFNLINDKQVNFSTMSIKAKSNLSLDGKDLDVTINFRIKRNEVIWAAVTYGPIEGARILITPDSLKVLLRQQDTYLKKPFKYIYEFTNEQVNFKTLQSILIGNTIDGVLNERSAVAGDGQKATITGMLGNLIYDLRYNSTHKVTQTNLKDPNKNQNLKVDYAEFTMYGDQQIPNFVKIDSKAANKAILAEMNYTSVKLNEPVDFPFSVPKRFAVKD